MEMTIVAPRMRGATMIPSAILTLWFSGLLALSLLAGAVYSGHEWYRRSWGWDSTAGVSVFDPEIGFNGTTALFLAALALGLMTIAGRPLVLAWLRFTRPATRDADPDPRSAPRPDSTHEIQRPDGSRLHVECYGMADAVPLICTHGWGLTSHEWNYLKRAVPPGHRLIVWDLPGLGRSGASDNRDFSIVKLAGDLAAVVDFASKPAVLLGHSIGGMITLTYLGLFAPAAGRAVSKVLLAHTTHTNPVRTTSGAALLTAIQKPVLQPLMYLTIVLSPLVRLLNWVAYANGSTHLLNKSSSFAGRETWQQIDFSARFQPRASPAVLARGMLGMFHYDASGVLPTIGSPTLIIAGDRDSTTKPSASEAMHEVIRGSQLLELVPAKHLGLIEHHADFAQAVTRFCAGMEIH